MAMRAATELPLTVKIRLDAKKRRQQDLKLAQIIEDCGIDALIVHGRSYLDDYDTPCDYDAIGELCQVVSIPVIVNGDIKDKASLSIALQKTKASGVMISRAGTGKPWLYQQLTQNFTVPNLQTIILLFIEHIEGLAKLESEHKALLQARKLSRYYFREFLKLEDIKALYQVNRINDLFTRLTEMASTIDRQLNAS